MAVHEDSEEPRSPSGTAGLDLRPDNWHPGWINYAEFGDFAIIMHNFNNSGQIAVCGVRKDSPDFFTCNHGNGALTRWWMGHDYIETRRFNQEEPAKQRFDELCELMRQIGE